MKRQSMRRKDRSELVKALRAFEVAANTPEDNATVIRASVEWEILFHKHKAVLCPLDTLRFSRRARVALQKALG
jgi:hypothetical protein